MGGIGDIPVVTLLVYNFIYSGKMPEYIVSFPAQGSSLCYRCWLNQMVFSGNNFNFSVETPDVSNLCCFEFVCLYQLQNQNLVYWIIVELHCITCICRIHIIWNLGCAYISLEFLFY